MLLTDISLKRPVFATVTILALIVLGFYSYLSLNVDEWPDVEFPYVTVRVIYRGAAPEQVDSKIIQKVEEAVSSISGVKHIYSTAREGVALTVVEFTLETSPSVAAQDVRDKIGRMRGDLPEEAEEPVIMRFDPTESPIASITVSGADVRALTNLVDDVIKRRLETISGVGSVDVRGSLTREIHIDLNREQVAALNLTIPEIIDNLKQENMEVPGGKLTHGSREISLRTAGNLSVAEEFLQLPVGRKEGVQLYVSNVATVRDTSEEPTSITRFNGKPAIGLDIMKQSGSNTMQVVRNIKKALSALQKDLPPGVQLTLVRDNSKNIEESVADVLFSLVIGGLLAVLIVFLFLGNWRSTLISAITIPASIIATFFMMKLLGFTINTMSLMGLSLAVGILIDDAIVVIENIVRHMEMGKDRYTAAAEATEEIGLAVTATTLTLVAVFVPVGMMTGIVGQFFKQFGITVAFAVMVSLFIAFTLTPMMSASFLDISQGQKYRWLGRILTWWTGNFDRLGEKYSRFLSKAMRYRLTVLAVGAVLFVASLGLVPFLGSSFMTKADKGEFTISVDVDPGTSVQGAAALADRMNEIIRATPEVVFVYSTADVDTITTFVRLQAKGDRKRNIDEINAELRQKLNSIPGVKVSIVVNSGGVADSKPVELTVRGESLDILGELAEKAQGVMEGTRGAVDVVSSYKPGKPDAQVLIKRDQAADLGVSTGNIADTLQTMFNGVTVSQFKDGDDRYDVVLRLIPEDRRNLDDLDNIYLAGKYKDKNDKTVLVPLSQVTETVYATSPSEIRRYDRQREIRLSANLDGVSLGEYNKQFMAKLNSELELPSGYNAQLIGESERMGEGFASIVAALALAIIFIFFVLAAQFESYIDPFSIMLSLPLAIIGAIGGLLVMRSDLSIMSFIGIIMLMGLVTKNAILLIEFAKQKMKEGVEVNAALVEAAQIRMRPIMMTTASTIFGVLPLAVGIGPGAEARAPMAHAIIGGMITSTLLTLVVVPVVYSLLNGLKRRAAATPGSAGIPQK